MTDEQILAIAAQLWQKNPGADFTMERLVEGTGLSRATLYRRVGSREALLQRLVDEQSLDVKELSLPDIRTRVVQATRTILARYGFAGVTVEQIAQEAGVGTATVYRHFGSKEALLEAFVLASSPRTVIRSFVANEESDLEADLTLLATTALEFIDENRGLFRLILMDKPESEPFLAQIHAMQGRTATSLSTYLAGHMAMGNIKQSDSFTLALSFIGMLVGLAFIGPGSYDRPITDVKRMAQLVTGIFLNGVAQTDPQKVAANP